MPAELSPNPLRAALLAVAALALAVPALVVTHPPALPRLPARAQAAAAKVAALPRRVVPPAELPPVEPVELVDLPPEDARAYNAAVPFADGPNPAARPFRFAGPAEDLLRATDCLAAAVLYEAGDDAVGERAVAQVVLNRLRHPAFPKTVCGVVFQGQERTTGCQFTFACDGALGRQPSDAGWRRAREVAAAALAGAVYRPVGLATHYHTDWVVPYWSASLDKVAAVHTHLFFRWSGWWGTPPAFGRHPEGAEPVIGKIAFLSEAHRGLPAPDGAEGEGGALTTALLAAAPAPQPVAGEESTFLQVLPRGLAPAEWPAYAHRLCGDRGYCKVLAWADARPAALPLTPAQSARMSFSYLRDRANGFEKDLWNCQAVRRPEYQCMKAPIPAAADRAAPAGPRPEADGLRALPRGPATLAGVRRRGSAPPPDAPATPPGTSPGAAP